MEKDLLAKSFFMRDLNGGRIKITTVDPVAIFINVIRRKSGRFSVPLDR
jgi:hypothetical protein